MAEPLRPSNASCNRPSPRLLAASSPSASTPSSTPAGTSGGIYGSVKKRVSYDQPGDDTPGVDGRKILDRLGMKATAPLKVSLFLFLPWLAFTLTMLPFALGYRRLAPLAWVVFALFTAVSVGLMWWSTQPSGEPMRYWCCLGLLCGLMTVLALLLGLLDYHEYIDRYRTYQNSRSYSNVVPDQDAGAFFDAGSISFSHGTIVDITKAAQYQGAVDYCAAPIIKEPDLSNGGAQFSSGGVGFWAVGEDCCDDAKRLKFWCGPVDNKKVRGGFVLMDPPADSKSKPQHPEYMKAVQKSAAQNDLFVPAHVRLVKWTNDPDGYAEAFWDDGVEFYRRAIGYFALVSGVLFVFILAQANKDSMEATGRKFLRLGATSRRMFAGQQAV